MGLAILREPYSGSHAHLPAVSAIGEEALAFGVRAEAAAVDGAYADALKPRSRHGVEVEQPVSRARRLKGCVRTTDRRAHLIAHFVDARPDGRAEPCMQAHGWNPRRLHRAPEHPARR